MDVWRRCFWVVKTHIYIFELTDTVKQVGSTEKRQLKMKMASFDGSAPTCNEFLFCPFPVLPLNSFQIKGQAFRIDYLR